MLSNKVIVVTGGAGLLGLSFCKAVLEQRGICILADISIEKGEEARQIILKENPNASIYFIQLDINNSSSIRKTISLINNQFGRIDALVNNAYPRNENYGRYYFDVEYEDFCENVNLNLGGYFITGKLFALHFIKQGYGNIINISSIYGVVAPRFEIYEGTEMTMPVEYAVIKSGLLHLTKYMAKVLKDKNIRVNAISLGGLYNNQPDEFLQKYKSYCLNKGMLNPNDISGALVFLLSDHSTFINGQNIIVDDGFTL